MGKGSTGRWGGQDPNVHQLIGDLFVDATDQDETVDGIQTPITLLSYGQFGFFVLLHESLHAATASFLDIDGLSSISDTRWNNQKYSVLSTRVVPEIIKPVTAPEGYGDDAANWHDSVTPYTMQLFDILTLQQLEKITIKGVGVN